MVAATGPSVVLLNPTHLWLFGSSVIVASVG